MPPLTVSLYLSKHFLKWFGIALVTCCFIGLLGDLSGISRIVAKGNNTGIADIINLSLLRLPNLIQEFLPFSFLFGSLGFFTRLSTTQELIIIRASGLSVWQFLTPVLILTASIGVLMITIWNPFVAIMSGKAMQIKKDLIYGTTNRLAISNNGLWLREDIEIGNGTGYVIIHAPKIISSEPITLGTVSYFIFTEDNRFIERIDSKRATLKEDYWVLEDVWTTRPDGDITQSKKIIRKTELNTTQIQENFVHPRTISFWKLPNFIEVANNAGFPTEEYRMYLHSLFAKPFLFCAMVLIAATFGLHSSRMGGGRIIILGVLSGLMLFFITDLMHTLGSIGLIPPILSAWTPSAIAISFGLTLLLHQEDG